MRAILILLLSGWTAGAATVVGSAFVNGQPLLTQPTLTPLFSAYVSGTNLVFPTVQVPRVGTNGFWTNTMDAGAWKAVWPGLPTVYSLVPDTNGTITFSSTVTNMFTNLVAQVSGHVLAGTSVVIVTNALGTPSEAITLSVVSVALATNAILATNSLTAALATNALTSVTAGLATNAVLATNALTATLATNAITATNALTAFSLTMTTNAAPTDWTNPVVWMKWTNAAGGEFFTPGYTNSH